VAATGELGRVPAPARTLRGLPRRNRCVWTWQLRQGGAAEVLAQMETGEQISRQGRANLLTGASKSLDREVRTTHTLWLLCPGDHRPTNAERRLHGDSPQLRLPVVVLPRRHGHRLL